MPGMKGGLGVSIIGVGESDLGVVPDRSSHALYAQAINAAIADAGLTKDRIDGLITLDCYAAKRTRHAVSVAQYAGLRSGSMRWISTSMHGSHSSSGVLLLEAAMAIRSGVCDYVVVAGADNLYSWGRSAGVTKLAENRDPEFGTGRSSTWNELGGFRADLDNTKKCWDEYVRTIPKMWTQERFRHQGYSFSMPERAVLPKPIQKPHPPMWVAVTAPGTEVDAGSRGLGFLGLSYGGYEAAADRFVKYRAAIETCEPVSDVVNNQIAVVNWLYCHENADVAAERGNGLVARFGSAAAQTLDTRQAFPTASYMEAGLLNKLRADPLAAWTDKAVPDGLCIGTPNQIIKSLKRWEALGVDRVLFLLQFSEMMPQEYVLESLKLFNEQVMPEFNKTAKLVPQLEGAVL